MERKRAERERLKAAGIGSATFKLPLILIAALAEYAKAQDMHQDTVVEKLLREMLDAE